MMVVVARGVGVGVQGAWKVGGEGNYKAANTEVDEELEVYKKSGDQYLEKQNFLKRAELREYETERDTRLNSDVRLRGRL
ncbi:hypothetical protein TSOC_009828 [Tetrabaena socialis]|uniref:BCNT-C domain-containing protein n=1 Tax=Tetrabaena socialis TaxID=47790 RepID=A0A2J7ZUY5_9CHLO|nr:hypothetical protein TSOC_009828 [Tetrabaena socialis]|eukprot:PNH04060.1 hypothetical protein TSOC_009828 [Tetrabaena socialis]